MTEIVGNNPGASSVSNAPIFSSTLDSFGRLRVSNPRAIIDVKQDADNLPLFFDEVISGAGASSTYDRPNAQSILGVTNNNEYVIRQTYERSNYQPGKSLLVLMTGVLNNDTDVQTRLGYIDADISAPYPINNGYYFESGVDNTFSVNIMKNGVADTVTQGNFNRDNLDGNGPSGVNIDLTKTQIFFVTFEWLGVGNATFGIIAEGNIIPIHEFTHANQRTTVYTRTPNLTLRYEIRSFGGAGELQQICASVMSEGGQDPVGINYSVDNDVTPVTVNTNDLFNLVTIRLRTGYEGKDVQVVNASILSLTNQPFRFGLLLNPTYTGLGAYTVLTETGIEYAYGGTVAGGFRLLSDYVTNRSSSSAILNNLLKIGTSIAGVQDTITLFAQRFTTSGDVVGTMNIRELT